MTAHSQAVRPGKPCAEDQGCTGRCKAELVDIQRDCKRLGHEWSSNSAREIWDNEFSVVAPAFAGIKYSRIENDGLQWPCPNEEHPVQGSFMLTEIHTGKGLFKGIEWTPPAEVADAEYPFVLSTGRRLYHYHTRTQTGRCGLERVIDDKTGLNQMMSEETVDISPVDATKLGIADKEMVAVSSRRGSVKVKARVTGEVAPGLCGCPFTSVRVTPTGSLTMFSILKQRQLNIKPAQ
jgi:formate dehydrogenase major subunit